MNPNHAHGAYTMPLKQLLRLLETTADEPARPRRVPRQRHDAAQTGSRRQPEPARVQAG